MEGILGKGEGLKDPSKNKEFLGKTFAAPWRSEGFIS
jgi:hypothetical protein